jgi:hypothetical protein
VSYLLGEAVDKMPDSREQVTAKAAVRILKARIREYLYAKKSREGSEQAQSRWQPLILVQSAFTAPALREWERTLRLWGDLSDIGNRRAVLEILAENFPDAVSEVLSIFDPSDIPDLRNHIEDYRLSTPFEMFLGGAS